MFKARPTYQNTAELDHYTMSQGKARQIQELWQQKLAGKNSKELVDMFCTADSHLYRHLNNKLDCLENILPMSNGKPHCVQEKFRVAESCFTDPDVLYDQLADAIATHFCDLCSWSSQPNRPSRVNMHFDIAPDPETTVGYVWDPEHNDLAKYTSRQATASFQMDPKAPFGFRITTIYPEIKDQTVAIRLPADDMLHDLKQTESWNKRSPLWKAWCELMTKDANEKWTGKVLANMDYPNTFILICTTDHITGKRWTIKYDPGKGPAREKGIIPKSALQSMGNETYSDYIQMRSYQNDLASLTHQYTKERSQRFQKTNTMTFQTALETDGPEY